MAYLVMIDGNKNTWCDDGNYETYLFGTDLIMALNHLVGNLAAGTRNFLLSSMIREVMDMKVGKNLLSKRLVPRLPSISWGGCVQIPIGKLDDKQVVKKESSCSCASG